MSESTKRERTVLEHIRNHPNLHHNALIKLLVPEFMAKATFEKTRDSLVEKGLISIQAKGNMRLYFPVSDYDLNALHYFEKVTHNSFHNLKNSTNKLQFDYQHKDVNEKIDLVIFLLKNLLQTEMGFTLLDSIKNPKKTLYKDEHLEIQRLIFQVFEIIRNNKDGENIFPLMISYLGIMLPKHVQVME